MAIAAFLFVELLLTLLTKFLPTNDQAVLLLVFLVSRSPDHTYLSGDFSITVVNCGFLATRPKKYVFS